MIPSSSSSERKLFQVYPHWIIHQLYLHFKSHCVCAGLYRWWHNISQPNTISSFQWLFKSLKSRFNLMNGNQSIVASHLSALLHAGDVTLRLLYADANGSSITCPAAYIIITHSLSLFGRTLSHTKNLHRQSECSVWWAKTKPVLCFHWITPTDQKLATSPRPTLAILERAHEINKWLSIRRTHIQLMWKVR